MVRALDLLLWLEWKVLYLSRKALISKISRPPSQGLYQVREYPCGLQDIGHTAPTNEGFTQLLLETIGDVQKSKQNEKIDVNELVHITYTGGIEHKKLKMPLNCS